MSNRIKINQVEPEAYKAMLAFDHFVETSLLSQTHKNLIKIRGSQVNGCAYCVDMHTREARQAGETEQRIYALSVWHDTPFFDEQERAILALTEEVTLIANHLSDETYNSAAALFDKVYLAQIIIAIININSWNRIGIALAMQPSAVKQ